MYDYPVLVCPCYKGEGRYSKYGRIVRLLARTYCKHLLPATRPDESARWKDGRHQIKALFFDDRVVSTRKPVSAGFRCMVLFDPRYHDPLGLVTNLPTSVSAQDLWLLYRDRWLIEQMPLAAKQMWTPHERLFSAKRTVRVFLR